MKGKLFKFILPGIVVVGLILFTTTYQFGMLEEMVGDIEEAAPAETVAEVIPPSYVEMSTLSIPVLKDGQIKTRVDLTLQLEVAQEDVAMVKTQLILIRDAYIRDLHDYLPKHMDKRTTPDLFMVKERLKRISARLANGKINDVVIKGAFNR